MGARDPRRTRPAPRPRPAARGARSSCSAPSRGPSGRCAWPSSTRMQFRAPRERVSGPAVIVDIDEASLARYGQWPWPRTLLARLVELIGRGRPAAIGLDIVMPEPDRLSPDRLARLIPGLDPELAGRLAALPSNDSVLASVIRGRPVVLGVAGIEDPAARSAPPGRRAPVRIGGGDLSPVWRFPGELRSVAVIDAAAAGHGLVNVDLEGGVVRRMPAVAEVAGLLMPTLAHRDAPRGRGGARRVGARRRARRRGGGRRRPRDSHPAGRRRLDPLRAPRPRALRVGRRRAVGRGGCAAVRAKARARRRDGARHRRLPGHARGRPDAGRRDPRPAHRGHLRPATCSRARGGPSGSRRRCSPRRAGS